MLCAQKWSIQWEGIWISIKFEWREQYGEKANLALSLNWVVNFHGTFVWKMHVYTFCSFLRVFNLRLFLTLKCVNVRLLLHRKLGQFEVEKLYEIQECKNSLAIFAVSLFLFIRLCGLDTLDGEERKSGNAMRSPNSTWILSQLEREDLAPICIFFLDQ